MKTSQRYPCCSLKGFQAVLTATPLHAVHFPVAIYQRAMTVRALSLSTIYRSKPLIIWELGFISLSNIAI